MVEQVFKSTDKLISLYGPFQEWILNYFAEMNITSLDRNIAKTQHGYCADSTKFNATFFYDIFEQYKYEHSKYFGERIATKNTIEIPDLEIPEVFINVEYLFVAVDPNVLSPYAACEVIISNVHIKEYRPFFAWNTLKIYAKDSNSVAMNLNNIPGGGILLATDVEITNGYFLASVTDLWNREIIFKINITVKDTAVLIPID